MKEWCIVIHKFKSQRTVLVNGFSKLGEEGMAVFTLINSINDVTLDSED